MLAVTWRYWGPLGRVGEPLGGVGGPLAGRRKREDWRDTRQLSCGKWLAFPPGNRPIRLSPLHLGGAGEFTLFPERGDSAPSAARGTPSAGLFSKGLVPPPLAQVEQRAEAPGKQGWPLYLSKLMKARAGGRALGRHFLRAKVGLAGGLGVRAGPTRLLRPRVSMDGGALSLWRRVTVS